jgi:ABC-type phosphate transport system substrate-binding protein
MAAALILFFCCSALACAADGEQSEPPRSIAVIVNPKVTQQSVTESELRKILVGETRFWDDGTSITLLIQAPVSWERDVLLGEVMEMTEAQYRQFWISKVFRTEVASGPKVVLSNSMAATLISKIPGCVAFVNSDDVPADAKVLQINGLSPGDEKYPLRF